MNSADVNVNEVCEVPYYPVGKARKRGIAGMVLGILSILLGGITGIIPLVLSIIGLVLSNKSLKEGPFGIAKAGKVTSIIGLIFAIIAIVIVVLCIIFYRQILTATFAYIFKMILTSLISLFA